MIQMGAHILLKLSLNTDTLKPQSETFEYICIAKYFKV